MLKDFDKAIPEPRGCGERESGGVYAECGLNPFGSPLEHFLFDPPLPLPDGVDLVNKPQLWMRIDPRTSDPVLDPDTNLPTYDLLIWIGAEHYPEAPDYVEETRRLGASRRLNPQMDLFKLTRRSRMLLAHPHALITSWRDLTPPKCCMKSLPNHDQAFYNMVYSNSTLKEEEERKALFEQGRKGMCVFKLWDVLPKDGAIEVFDRAFDLPLCVRRIGSTTYEYSPTGEQVTGWEPGFILGLPITNIALIQFENGSVNERAKEKLLKGLEVNQGSALPFYETDK